MPRKAPEDFAEKLDGKGEGGAQKREGKLVNGQGRCAESCAAEVDEGNLNCKYQEHYEHKRWILCYSA